MGFWNDVESALESAKEIGKAHDVSEPVVVLLKSLLATLPPLLGRQQAQELLGSAFSAKTLANADSMGSGPRVRMVIGGHKVVYPSAYLLEWLETRGVLIVPNREV